MKCYVFNIIVVLNSHKEKKGPPHGEKIPHEVKKCPLQIIVIQGGASPTIAPPVVPMSAAIRQRFRLYRHILRDN